jgi:predicted Na+-dependent transporter
LASLLGHLVFPGDKLTITGLVLEVVIPSGVTSLLWVSVYKGDTLLTLTIALIDTLFSPIIVPYSVAFFSGTTVEMDTVAIMKGIAAGAALAVAYFPAAVGFPSFSVPCFNKYWLPCMVHS